MKFKDLLRWIGLVMETLIFHLSTIELFLVSIENDDNYYDEKILSCLKNFEEELKEKN